MHSQQKEPAVLNWWPLLMDMWADMFPIELLSIQSTATQLTCPPSIPLLVTFTVKCSADSSQIRYGL